MNDKYKKLSKEELLRVVERQEKELKTKKYGLVWDSEREPEQVVLDCEENLPILERAKGKEVKTNNCNDNILIEGDNYHALTVLNYTHKESIDVIYIDPPFNTGNKTWKYNNDYVDEEDGYRHSKWLNMMGKRLRISRNLLTDSGIIIVAIDDYESHNLRCLMDNIFGEKNRLGAVCVVHKPGGRQDDKFFPTAHEYMLFYGKDIKEAHIQRLGESEEKLKEFKYEDEFGKYKLRGFRRSGSNSDRKDGPGLWYSVFYNPDTSEIKLEGQKGFVEIKPIDSNGREKCWRWGPETFSERKDKYIEIREIKGRHRIYVKERETDYEGQKATTIWDESKYSAVNGTLLLKQIMGERETFDYPKSLELLKDALLITTKESSTVLDFFAGSGTTGQAVLELNKEDNGNRNFILCTNNEVSDDEEKEFKKEHYLSDSEFKKWQKENKKEWLDFQKKNGICSAVCYPRIKKVIEGYDYEGKEKELVWEKDFNLNTLRWGKADEIYQEYEEKKKEIKEKYDDYGSSFQNNLIRLYGVKEVKGKKEGVGGNLQYFKTSFVKKTKNNDQLKLNLTQKCTQMLCVKENIYNLEKEDEDYKIFSSSKRDKYLCVYYNFVDNSFDEFLKKLGKIKKEKKIYMFSTDNEVDKSLFEELENFSIEPIPQPILNIYRQLIRLNIK